jgi:hypothetical protein
MPTFGSDEKFLPLQAADFWAWWVRKGYEEGTLAQYQNADFGTWKGTKKIPMINITFSEDQLAAALIKRIKTSMGLGFLCNVYDAKMRPRTKDEISAITPRRSEMMNALRRLVRRYRRGR